MQEKKCMQSFQCDGWYRWGHHDEHSQWLGEGSGLCFVRSGELLMNSEHGDEVVWSAVGKMSTQ